MSDADLIPAEEFVSVDGLFRASLKKLTPEIQMGFRRVVRIMSDPESEPKEVLQAFSTLARYTLYEPEKRVDHSVSHTHRLTLGGEALAALGFERTRTVVQKPDGDTEVLDGFALGAEPRDAQVVDGD